MWRNLRKARQSGLWSDGRLDFRGVSRRVFLFFVALFFALAGSAFASEVAAPAELEDAVPVASKTGGVSADAAPGGDADPRKSGAIVYGAPAPPRPVARVFRVTRSVV